MPSGTVTPRAEAKSPNRSLSWVNINIRGWDTAPSAVVSLADEPLGRSDLGRRTTLQPAGPSRSGGHTGWARALLGITAGQPRDSDFASALGPSGTEESCKRSDAPDLRD